MADINKFRSEILSKGVQVASHFDIEFALPGSLRQVTVDNPVGTVSGEGTDEELRQRTVTTTLRRGPSSTRQLSLRCENVSLPDISVNTMETHRFGIGTADIVPYGISYLESTMTFIGDQNGDVYKIFYDWINRIMKMPDQPTARAGISGSTTYEVGFKVDVIVDEMKIHAYDHQHNKIYTAVMFDAFPRSIVTTALNWAAGDELVRYTVFFSYKDFRIDFNSRVRGTAI